jgi:sugar phosphate isomerase/epimerase
VITVSYMSANEVARETAWQMRGWGHGDRATSDAFRPLETFAERFDALCARARALGFGAIDVWGAHLSPEWATDAHVEAARAALDRHGLRVASLAAWVGPGNAGRACELALALGTDVVGGGFSGDAASVAAAFRGRGVRLAVENHPERTPAELLARIRQGGGAFGATVDTGWWGTQGYDPVRAIRELAEHVLHVHLKDVLREGEPHETCRWGEGVVDAEGCVRALREFGYARAISVEHEPETFDPSDDVRAMRIQLEEWLR